ncbi:MAG: hypothetical protein H7343_22260 [Undibacterium sp.]|nr:hypothetical protein [Opitutaceae bacterium]
MTLFASIYVFVAGLFGSTVGPDLSAAAFLLGSLIYVFRRIIIGKFQRKSWKVILEDGSTPITGSVWLDGLIFLGVLVLIAALVVLALWL